MGEKLNNMERHIKVLTSEVKKGDIFSAGNQTFRAESDAYIDKDTFTWSVDLYGGYVYGFFLKDVKIEVIRGRETHG